jgi:hypothetical protein
MSRVSRYKDSFKGFINRRSCLIDLKGTDLYNTIKDHIDNDTNFLLPILMLTIMNNQTKKHKVSFLGYYAATGIEFLCIYIELLNYKEHYTDLYGYDKYNRLTNLLLIWCFKSWQQNLESVKRHLTDDKISKLYSNFITLLNNKIGINGILCDNIIEGNENIKTDLHRSYLNTCKPEMLKKFKQMKQISKKCMDKIVENRMCNLTEFIILTGWLLGCGSESSLSKLIKSGKTFGIMYQIALDFINIKRDIKRLKAGGYTFNYVLNCGIQDSYEKFMENKQKFIEEALKLDIFSSTMKEIVDIIEIKVDNIINETSPDLRSNYSTIK